MTEPPRREYVMTTGKLFVILALCCFLLSAFSVGLPIVNLLALGLAFLAASYLV